MEIAEISWFYSTGSDFHNQRFYDDGAGSDGNGYGFCDYGDDDGAGSDGYGYGCGYGFGHGSGYGCGHGYGDSGRIDD